MTTRRPCANGPSCPTRVHFSITITTTTAKTQRARATEAESRAPVSPGVHRVRVDQSVERVDSDADGAPPEPDGVELAGGDVAADGLDRDREDLGGLGQWDEAAGGGDS